MAKNSIRSRVRNWIIDNKEILTFTRVDYEKFLMSGKNTDVTDKTFTYYLRETVDPTFSRFSGKDIIYPIKKINYILNYEKLILKKFNEFGLKPRDGQLKIIDRIIYACVNNKKKYILLNAPTGTGKSIIGIISSSIIWDLYKETKSDLSEMQPMQIITSTKALQDQYDEFCETSEKTDHLIIKGAANYKCFANPIPNSTAKQCYIKSLLFSKESEKSTKKINKKCFTCEYKYVQENKNSKKTIITNYAYHFVDRIYLSKQEDTHGKPLCLNKRFITIYDEAHSMNENFVSHMSILFSKERASEIRADIGVITPKARAWANKQLDFVVSGIENKYISKNNYKHIYLKTLFGLYEKISSWFKKRLTYTQNPHEYFVYKNLADKYFSFGCKIDDLFIYEYDSILDVNYDKVSFVVKPIFMNNIFKDVVSSNSTHCILMSATLSAELTMDMLSLDTKEIEIINADNTFNVSDKKVIIDSALMTKMNFVGMKDKKIVNKQIKNINKILLNHKDDKGLILGNSFAFCKIIANKINTTHDIILHEEGISLEDILDKFKDSENSILISPSIFEGLDFPGDFSRFNIMIKAPYPSLGDKRMNFIARNHPMIYKQITLQKIIQGMGRSTRFKGDKSTTYFLDTHLEKLFNSRFNTWKNQFEINNK